MIRKFYRYYRDLYSSKINVSEEQLHHFSDNLTFSQLTDEERKSLEGPFTNEEYKKILVTFNSGKSPREDGFTAEFYSAFFDLTGADFVKHLIPDMQKVNCQSLKEEGLLTLYPKMIRS